MTLTGFHTPFAALFRTGFLHLPFWLARCRSVMTTFFKRFPAAKQNQAQWAIFRLFAQWVKILEWKKKFVGSGGIDGRLSRVYLTVSPIPPYLSSLHSIIVKFTKCYPRLSKTNDQLQEDDPCRPTWEIIIYIWCQSVKTTFSLFSLVHCYKTCCEIDRHAIVTFVSVQYIK